jgi:hypothetical protein
MTPAQQQQLDDTAHRLYNAFVNHGILWIVVIVGTCTIIVFLWNFFSPYFRRRR